MIPQLGFGDTDLSDGWTETAGGRVKAKAGRLASVMVGHARAQDVVVTFIDDERIGDKALLGMSFLSHFRLTIEEPGDGIMLMAR
jgi:aspartyl protease family protein